MDKLHLNETNSKVSGLISFRQYNRERYLILAKEKEILNIKWGYENQASW